MNLFKVFNKKLNYLKFYKFKQNKILRHNFEKSKKYLIIAPHPDDELLYTSSLLFNSVKNVSIFCFSHGHNLQRSNEFKNLMKNFNLEESKIFRYSEGEMINYEEISNIEYYNYIFVPNYINSHFDHYKIHISLKKTISKIKFNGKICLYEDNGSLAFPNFFMDISVTAKKKYDFFKDFYISQANGNFPFIESIKSLNFYRGSLVGVKYAEFFTFLDKQEYLSIIND